MDFYQTVMGKHFYEGTMPQLNKNLEKLTAAVEKLTAGAEKKEPIYLKEVAYCIIDDFEDWLDEKDRNLEVLVPEEDRAHIADKDFDFLIEKILDKMTWICEKAGVPYNRDDWN